VRRTTVVKSIRGRYNGRVVILEEPAPVAHEVAVIVEFPDEAPREANEPREPKRFHWEEAQAIEDGYQGSLADEVIRQRREEQS
jgi:hypothetical protein